MTIPPAHPPSNFPDPLEASPSPPTADPPTASGIGRLTQLLLDPKSLQILMLAGGGLLVLGLLLWLTAIGVFEEPLHAAIGLGLGNLALIGVGVATVLKTRYKIAGRAIAMLGSLLLPLNLWFYDTQGLVTLSEGGHLWVPALFCCIAYAALARLLKDSLFVYTIVAGVAMTGLLLLADSGVERFWEIVAPSTLLVAIGVICVHVERLFPKTATKPGEEAFTRDDFGRAFFRAGHAALASGLVLLLGGRLVGLFGAPLLNFIYSGSYPAVLEWYIEPNVAIETSAKLIAMLLAIVGIYTYTYSQIVIAEGRRFTLSAVLMLVWACVIGLDLFHIAFTEQLFVGLLALISIVCTLATRNRLLSALGEESAVDEHSTADKPIALEHAARISAFVGLAMLVFQFGRGLIVPQLESHVFSLDVGFQFDVTYFLSAGLLLLGSLLPRFVRRSETNTLDVGPMATGSGIALLGIAGGLVATLPWLATVGLAGQITVLALVPMALAILGLVKSNDTWKTPVIHTAEVLAMLLGLMVPFIMLGGATTSSTLAAMACGTLGLASLLAAIASGRWATTTLATILLLIAGWQSVLALEVGVEVVLHVASISGLIALLTSRVLDRQTLNVAGRLTVLTSGVAGLLFTASQVGTGGADATLLAMIATQTAVASLGAWLSRTGQGRRTLAVLAGCGVIATGITLSSVSTLNVPQRIELMVVAASLSLLAAGHLGWQKETVEQGNLKRRDSYVGVNLWIGSLFSAGPLLLGLILGRLGFFSPAWTSTHEVAVLALGLLLVGSGVLCRLRATTLTGAASLVIYVASLVLLIDIPDRLQSTAIYLMVGGGLFFGSAVLLSVYRDRLLALSDHIREGDGVFAVLKWR